MTAKPIVVVHGATGLQGGSVARHLAALGYGVRAVVRDTNVPAAAALASVPNITLAHVPSLLDATALRAAYSGADAVFGCTAVSPEEEAHGNAMADAAKAEGIKNFIWSALPSIHEATNGEMSIEHFESKDHVSKYLRQLGVPGTHIYTGAFMENYTRFSLVTRTESGELQIKMPGPKLDFASRSAYIGKDLPRIVQIILEHQDEFLGRDLVCAPTPLSFNHAAARIEALTGIKTTAIETPIPAHLPWAKSLVVLWKYSQDERYVKFKGLPTIDPKLTEFGFQPASFDEFVKEEIIPYLKL